MIRVLRSYSGPYGMHKRRILRDKSIACFDFDSEEALEDFLNILGTTLEKLATWTRVEWHGIPGKVHIFFITSSASPFKNFAGAGGLEIKANRQLVFVSPSLHAGKDPNFPPDPSRFILIPRITSE